MKRLVVAIIIIFSSSLFSQQNAYSFSGNVRGYENSKPLHGVHIVIQKSNVGVATDINGLFKIDSLNEETHIITISFLGYMAIKDTITFSSTQHSINKTYELQYVFKHYNIEQTSEFEKYHLDLKVSAGDNEIIEFTIDSLVYGNYGLEFYSSFKNNTALPIYILQEKECIRPFVFGVYNSVGKKIGRNMISLSCDDKPFFNPTSNDLIKIPPHFSYKYKRTSIWLYSFKRLPKDNYTINISYNFNNPMKLRIPRQKRIDKYSSSIYTARIALRGIFKSTNTLKFSN